MNTNNIYSKAIKRGESQVPNPGGTGDASTPSDAHRQTPIQYTKKVGTLDSVEGRESGSVYSGTTLCDTQTKIPISDEPKGLYEPHLYQHTKSHQEICKESLRLIFVTYVAIIDRNDAKVTKLGPRRGPPLYHFSHLRWHEGTKGAKRTFSFFLVGKCLFDLNFCSPVQASHQTGYELFMHIPRGY